MNCLLNRRLLQILLGALKVNVHMLEKIFFFSVWWGVWGGVGGGGSKNVCVCVCVCWGVLLTCLGEKSFFFFFFFFEKIKKIKKKNK